MIFRKYRHKNNGFKGIHVLISQCNGKYMQNPIEANTKNP